MIRKKSNGDAERHRSDKGEIRATKRDLAYLQWNAEQYAVRGDQIQHVLSRYPDPQHPFHGELLSASATRGQISRWVQAGWIVYKRVLAKGPGWAYVTRAGLKVVDLETTFRPKPPSTKRLDHIYAVNQVRLWMEEEEQYGWMSERQYRASLHLKKGERSGPIPDAVIWAGEDTIAVEVQISDLKPHEWVTKLSDLAKATIYSRKDLRYVSVYDEIWMYVPSEAMKKMAEDARSKLRDEYQARIYLEVEDDLLMEGGEDAWG
jgi:hypothetical protein